MKQHHIIAKIRRLFRRAQRFVRRHAGAVFISGPTTGAILILGLALLWPPQPAPTTALAKADSQHATFAARFEGAR